MKVIAALIQAALFMAIIIPAAIAWRSLLRSPEKKKSRKIVN
jgi:hypothetical protein